MITNTPGNFCQQFSFFYSIDTKWIVSMSGTPPLNKTNVNNKFSTVATRVIHEV